MLFRSLLDDKILESFWWDVVNVDKIYEDLSTWRIDDTRSYKNPFMDKEITKKQIRNFLKSRGAVKYKHYAVPQHNDTFSDLHPRGQYWIIRNFDKWRSASIQDLRDHFNDPLLNLRKAKDKKNHQSILDSGYKSDSERTQGNALYDKLIEETKIKNSPLLNKIMKG